jgi:hypothetical protein
MNVEIPELAELVKRIGDPQVNAALARRMQDAVNILEKAVKANAPVDGGQTRASFHTQVRDLGTDVIGSVGTNLKQAWFMEYGTGLLSDAPNATHKRHWPPGAALEVWASRHGFGKGGGYIVARIIGLRGGLAPRRFMRNALRDNLDRVWRTVAKAADDVAKRMAG